MSKDIKYAIVFFLVILAGSFLFVMYFNENISRIQPSNIKVVQSTNEWVNSSVTISISYDDSKQTISEYSIDNGATWQKSNEFVVDNNKKFKILVKNSDGKKSDALVYRVKNIDKVPPVIEIDEFIEVEVDTLEDLRTYANIYDTESGVADDLLIETFNIDDSVAGNTYQATYSVSDNASNLATKVVYFSIVD